MTDLDIVFDALMKEISDITIKEDIDENTYVKYGDLLVSPKYLSRNYPEIAERYGDWLNEHGKEWADWLKFAIIQIGADKKFLEVVDYLVEYGI